MPNLFDPLYRSSTTGEGGTFDVEVAQAALREARKGSPGAAATVIASVSEGAQRGSEGLLETTSLTEVRSEFLPAGLPSHARFRDFLVDFWAWLRLPHPTANQLEMADWMQDSPDRAITMGFRGIAKSWITGAYSLWRLYRDPVKEKIFVVSASLRKAVNFVTFCLQSIRGCPFLQWLEPGPKQRQSAQGFDTAQAAPDQNPSLYAGGITGQLNGPRASLIVPDDIETSSNSLTVTMRDKIRDSVKEFDAIILPGGQIKYLGTPQTEESLYLLLVKERGYVVRIWPSEYPDRDRLKRYGDKLSPLIRDAIENDPTLAGHTTEPTRFPDDDLAKRKLSWGPAGYALQFLLDASLSDADRYPLKLKNLIVMALDRTKAPDVVAWGNDEKLLHKALPNLGFEGDHYYGPANDLQQVPFSPYSEIVAAVDPSGRGLDETAIAIGGELHAMVFWLHAAGWRNGYAPETLQAIADLCVSFNVGTLLVESNFGDGTFTQLLRPYVTEAWEKANAGRKEADRGGTKIVEVRSGKAQKERRILSVMEPVTMQHRLVVNSEVIEQDFRSLSGIDGEETRHRYSSIYQFTHITHEKDSLVHDDRLESLEMLCEHFAPRLGVNPIGMAERAAEEREEEELEKLLRNAVEIGGGKVKPQRDRAKGTLPRGRR